MIEVLKPQVIHDQLLELANESVRKEPYVAPLLQTTITASNCFADLLARLLTHRLGNSSFLPLFRELLTDEICLILYKDAQAVATRDPAFDSILPVMLFAKGWASLAVHRIANRLWEKQPLTATYLQSLVSQAWAVDIHPAADMGVGILLDHGTGIVIGETAVVGDGCTLLHGVTLGGTGKESGDRHPKIGPRVLIGAGASILGNIRVGAGAKIGAGSIVLRPIPAGATAVGAPAKIIGRAMEEDPASSLDDALEKVAFLHKSSTDSSLSTASTQEMSTSEDDEGMQQTTLDQDDGASETSSALLAAEEEESDDIGRTLSLEERKSLRPLAKRKSRSQSYPNGKDTAKIVPVSCFCPFRSYARLGKHAPAGSLSLSMLHKWLQGCHHSHVGSICFALDAKNVGYVPWQVLVSAKGKQVVQEETGWSEAKVDEWAEEIRKAFDQTKSTVATTTTPIAVATMS